ncbi:MAG: 2TM domain-containing protein [Chloroflexota bacterium]|nr:2TM domain-containing protein [Chloroflexota bacterium]
MSRSVDTQPQSNTDTTAQFQRLRWEFVEGHITLDEFEEKLAQVQVYHEAPQPPGGLSIAPPHRVPSRPWEPGDGVGGHVTSYLLVMAMLVGIWALTGADYFWPIWPMMGWGIGVASHVLGGRGGCHSGQDTRTFRGRP